MLASCVPRHAGGLYAGGGIDLLIPTGGVGEHPPAEAEVMSEILQAMGVPGYEAGFKKVKVLPHRLAEPLQRSKSTLYFVNSMSDLFHKDVPVEFIQRVFDVMQRAHWHQFQVLTKRANRLEEVSPMIGTYSLLPRRRRKSSTRFIAILRLPSFAVQLAQPFNLRSLRAASILP